MTCSSNGYPYAKGIYYRRKENDDYRPLGLMALRVSFLKTPEHHEVYCDKFFASHDLLVKATGTVRDAKAGSCPQKSLKDVERKNVFHYKCDGRPTHAGGTTMQSSVSSNHLIH
ncbi:hypothetical protein HPB50_028371 [Hyalomma asiaticum]|nr:hypothetical protein HPB50_028371 [Hyalomma asiaticum]